MTARLTIAMHMLATRRVAPDYANGQTFPITVKEALALADALIAADAETTGQECAANAARRGTR